jgi:hypothetical protein
MKNVIETFKSHILAGFFVTICDLVYFYTSLAYSTDLLIYVAAEQIIIRSTFTSSEVTSTSLINFGNNSICLCPIMAVFKQNTRTFLS